MIKKSLNEGTFGPGFRITDTHPLKFDYATTYRVVELLPHSKPLSDKFYKKASSRVVVKMDMGQVSDDSSIRVTVNNDDKEDYQLAYLRKQLVAAIELIDARSQHLKKRQ